MTPQREWWICSRCNHPNSVCACIEVSEPKTRPTDIDAHCYEKARANGEDTFTLRAQDITAPLVIDFWIKTQCKMRELVKQGMSEDEAEKAVRAFYFLDQPEVQLMDRKLSQACAIAGAMERWPGRRLAD